MKSIAVIFVASFISSNEAALRFFCPTVREKKGFDKIAFSKQSWYETFRDKIDVMLNSNECSVSNYEIGWDNNLYLTRSYNHWLLGESYEQSPQKISIAKFPNIDL